MKVKNISITLTLPGGPGGPGGPSMMPVGNWSPFNVVVNPRSPLSPLEPLSPIGPGKPGVP